MLKRSLCLTVAILAACKSSTAPVASVAGAQVAFDTTADLTSQDHFYDFPWPSDFRLDATGHPDMRGFVNGSDNPVVAGLLAVLGQHKGFPVIPAAYFRFNAPLATRTIDATIAADKSSPLLLIDVESGALSPVVAVTLPPDDFTPANLLAVAPHPGVVLRPLHPYAFVVMRSANDAAGAPLGIPLSLQQLKQPLPPGAARATSFKTQYDKLWAALKQTGVSVDNVAAATVFTTGDVVQDLADLSTRLRDTYKLEITNLHLAADGDHPGYCALSGQISYPQFQEGTPPYDTKGLFKFGADGLPIKQRDETAPVVIAIPKGTPMPAAGFPLVTYVHGSGGLSTSVIDRGKTLTLAGMAQKGEGPASIYAPFGIASAATAMPLNPERLPGAADLAYLNFVNLSAFPFTFWQGVSEQRMFIDTMLRIELDPAVLGSCAGVTLPAGAAKIKFDAGKLVEMGQSMGGMYTNMITATEPRVSIAVPTGAGGFWSDFIISTPQVDGQTLLSNVFNVQAPLNFLHPVLQLLEVVWEPADPLVFTPRIARRPLPGAPVRPIYEVVGSADSYFSTDILNAMALGYGNQEAGDQIWPTLQPNLALENRAGMATYPVKQNRMSESGAPYTGVVVQYANDGILDGHYVSFQLDAVKYQYGCFLHTFLTTGVAVVPAPAALGTACPE
jgi:hypothetical protein